MVRLHNVAAYPAMYDWDAGGHAVNVVDLLEMHWPNPRSWCGSHPPLYYALSAVLSVLLPASVPIHVTMRLLSAGAWVATVGLVWRSLRWLGSKVDAAVVAALLLSVPGLTIASCMMTNDALCALFVTATLVRLLQTPPDWVPNMRHVVVTGALAGLAAMTKATGVAAVGMAAAFYAWRARQDPLRGLRALGALGATSAAIAGPHYARLFFSVSGSPYTILAARAASQEKEVIATVVHEIARATSHFSSFAALFHAALWGDPTAVFLPRDIETHPLAQAVSAGGLFVLGLAVAGAVRLLVSRNILRRAAVALVFGASYAAALVPHALDRPYIVLTKTNYLLPDVLPVAIVLAVGLGWLRGRLGTVLRAVVLFVAAGGVALTVYGWWETAPTVSRSIRLHDASARPAVVAVERYFQYRAADPIRAVRLLDPRVQLAHGLRLVRILGLPPLAPDPELAPEDERSLELARARVAWLELYNLIRWMQPVAAALDVRLLDVNQRSDAADVRVRVAAAGTTPPGGDIGLWPFPSFDQHFTLERGDGEWRITSVDQSGVLNENTVQAFVADPTLAGFEHLRELGWRPPWERAVASVVHQSP